MLMRFVIIPILHNMPTSLDSRINFREASVALMYSDQSFPLAVTYEDVICCIITTYRAEEVKSWVMIFPFSFAFGKWSVWRKWVTLTLSSFRYYCHSDASSHSRLTPSCSVCVCMVCVCVCVRLQKARLRWLNARVLSQLWPDKQMMALFFFFGRCSRNQAPFQLPFWEILPFMSKNFFSLLLYQLKSDWSLHVN